MNVHYIIRLALRAKKKHFERNTFFFRETDLKKFINTAFSLMFSIKWTVHPKTLFKSLSKFLIVCINYAPSCHSQKR